VDNFFMAQTPHPTEAQRKWMELGYGMFLHFGPNTFAGVGWGDGTFPAEKFAPTDLDCDQWAGVMAEAGMKYAVLTTKHHDGFCLWPSRFTDYSVKNAGVKTDIVAAFVEACRRAGIRPGLYYSLWDRHFPRYEDDRAYAQHMANQVRELLSDYGDIVEMWFDGGWDKETPERTWPWREEFRQTVSPEVLSGSRWGWCELYQSIHSLQPDCMVINNSCSDRPGIPRYFPIDVRTAERFNFVYEDKLREPVIEPLWRNAQGEPVYLPLEYCDSLNPDWFYNPKGTINHASAATIAEWHGIARRTGANLLLNVGPDTRGRIPEFHRKFLREAAGIIERGG
jgi:alpha-L-fucosidase